MIKVFVHPDHTRAQVVTSSVTGNELSNSFDCRHTIDALAAAISALEEGDGSNATHLVADAFARLVFFHKTI